jgi:phosphoglycerate dehydrogenase-like enzyme
MREKVEVLITLPLPQELVDEIRQFSEFLHVSVAPARTGKDVPEELWKKAEVLYTMHTLPEPDQAPNLRWVQAYLAGVDKIRADPLFEREKLVLTTMSGANAPQVAEHALTMMLALGHNLPKFGRLQHEKVWMPDKGLRYIPRELRDSTVGIIGYGSIGRQLARLVHGLGAEVLAVKRDAMDAHHHGYHVDGLGDPGGELFRRLYPPEALRSMVQECDFVVVTVPMTAGTTGLMGETALSGMRSTAYLVDVSRGGVVDHHALIAALQEGRIAGVALDVFPEEPLPEDSPLWTLPNVIITPHVAGFSPQYDQRANHLFLENLGRYLSGQTLLNLVRKEREY